MVISQKDRIKDASALFSFSSQALNKQEKKPSLPLPAQPQMTS